MSLRFYKFDKRWLYGPTKQTRLQKIKKIYGLPSLCGNNNSNH
jgi:hypothetical protein